MIIRQVVGHISDVKPDHHHAHDLTVERLFLTWDELRKRILRKTTDAGRDVGIQLAKGHLHPGDILWQEGKHVIMVEVKEEAVLVVFVHTMREMGLAAHAAGNMHAPVEITTEAVVTPYNAVLERQLQNMGLMTHMENRPFAP